MEAGLVLRPGYEATDLLGPDFAVPINDPRGHSPQPRPRSDRHTKNFFKSIPRITLHPVISTDGAPKIKRSKSRSNKSLNGAGQPQSGNNNGILAKEKSQTALGDTCTTTYKSLQSKNAPLELEQDGFRIPKLKLLFRKSMRLQKVPHIIESSSSHHNAEYKAHPAIINTEGHTSSVIVNPNPVVEAATVPEPASSVTSRETTASHRSTEISGALLVDSASSIEQALNRQSSSFENQVTSIPITQKPSVHVSNTSGAVNPSQLEGVPTSQMKDYDTGTVEEEIGSTRMYSPEQGIFVGKLYELPPPEILQLRWRQVVRPQLVKNLRAVIASLPQSLTTTETTIEPELIMSGSNVHGQSTVTLAPTIWIRCGGKQCRKAVQKAVADLSFVQRTPVHVTLHAPRRASAEQAPGSLSRNPVPYTEDEILPVEPSPSTQPARVIKMSVDSPLPTHISLRVRVQSLVDNQRSTCGLRIQFSFPNGTRSSSTLGGLVLLGDTVVGLTTAHAILDRQLWEKETWNSAEYPSHDLRGNVPSQVSRIKFAVPASLRAASFGKLYTLRGSASAHVCSNSEDNHDFALLQLDAKKGGIASNIYQTSHGRQIVNEISEDLGARAVQILCSSRHVKPGHLIEGDCVTIDKTGYWETRKIQLEEPLRKSRSQSTMAQRELRANLNSTR
jgi:hypothetical protein